MLDGKADLHTHTHHSDGALSPLELIIKAQSVGLGAISITDHDTVHAVGEATSLGKQHDVEVVPGIELSATYNDSEIHLLGYFVDVTNEPLLESLAIFREERLKRVERIVNKLNRMNIPLTVESVLANAGQGTVGKLLSDDALYR